MLTKKDYCDYETKAALCEVGFPMCTVKVGDSPTLYPDIPLYVAQKWLREEKKIVVLVHHMMTEEGDWEWEISYKYSARRMYASYEEALSEGIKEAVKLLEGG